MNDNPLPNESLSPEKMAEEYLAGWKRALADYDNLKKDLKREREEARVFLLEELTHDLLRVLDHFDQALAHTPPFDSCAEDVQKKLRAWKDGLVHIHTAFEEAIKRWGLESIAPAPGDPFNPEVHEPVDGEGGSVANLQSRGWKLNGKVLRPAKVTLT
ncbi:nucleotide exchange factor GrpE [Candidatus Uhrbacteria bacterium]|nr:nucleotide exchange factor GrpE [Candidatus Uhrbacteria bacterium]